MSQFLCQFNQWHLMNCFLFLFIINRHSLPHATKCFSFSKAPWWTDVFKSCSVSLNLSTMKNSLSNSHSSLLLGAQHNGQTLQGKKCLKFKTEHFSQVLDSVVFSEVIQSPFSATTPCFVLFYFRWQCPINLY